MAAPTIPMAQILSHLGQAATVRRPYPHADVIATSVFWLPMQVESLPGAALSRTIGRRALAVPKSDVPQLPRETAIEVPEPPAGETARYWIVDGPVDTSAYEQYHGFDHHRVVVVANDDYAE